MTALYSPPRLRDRLREIMEPYRGDESSTGLSLAMDVVVILAILASCTLVGLEHAYPYHHAHFWPWELGFTAFFIVEYLLRWYGSENRWRYPVTSYAIIDLLAILPTLLLLSTDLLVLRAVRGVRLLALLRLLRLVRLLKFFRFGFLLWRGLVQFRTWLSAVNDQYHLVALGRLLLWFVIAWFVSANLIHVAESGAPPGASPFARYGQAYWSLFVDLVSGVEKDPSTVTGRTILAGTMFFGIVWLALFTGQIVAMLVKRAERQGKVALKPPRARLEQHLVILGVNKHLDGLLRELHAATGGKHWVLVVAPEAGSLQVTDPRLYRRVFALAKDPVRVEVLAEAQLETAWRVIVLATDPPEGVEKTDDRALMETLAVHCRRLHVPMVVHLHNADTARTVGWLESQGIEFFASQRIGQSLLCHAALNPGITRVYSRLMTFVTDPHEIFTVPVPPELVGKTFSAAQYVFLEEAPDQITLIGLDRSPVDRPGSAVILNPLSPGAACPAEARMLRAEDRLIVISRGRPALYRTDQEALWSGMHLHRP